MAEIGIDLSDRRPKPITREDVEWADVVVTMGCGDVCPVFPGKEYLDWNLADPVGMCLEEVRELRAVIDARVAAL
jgi:protein-tyrosine-phosphatase